jgi:hypothetical protein
VTPDDVPAFMRRHRLAVQASVSATGGAQAAVVAFANPPHIVEFSADELTR